MLAARTLMGVFLSVSLGWAVAPAYSLSTVVNAATGAPASFAPNSIVSIYGTSLAYSTEAMPAGETVLPRALAGVQVVIDGITTGLFYVSPQQINFLVPSTLLPGTVKLFVARQGLAGPVLSIQLSETAPGFFPTGSGTVIATHADGTVLTDDSPAKPEEVIVLYAAGLGRTDPDADPGRAATRAAPLLLLSKLIVLLGGVPTDPSRVLYAGITPGFAGLYQINLRIPPGVTANPEIRVFIGQQGSPSFLKLPVRIQ